MPNQRETHEGGERKRNGLLYDLPLGPVWMKEGSGVWYLKDLILTKPNCEGCTDTGTEFNNCVNDAGKHWKVRLRFY